MVVETLVPRWLFKKCFTFQYLLFAILKLNADLLTLMVSKWHSLI